MKLPELKKIVKNKKVIAAIVSAVVVGSGATAVLMSNKADALFDPSKYQKTTEEQTSNVSVDSSVFGSSQDDSTGLEVDKKAQEQYDLNQGEENQLKDDTNTNSNNLLALGMDNGSGSNNNTPGIIGSDTNSNVTITGDVGGGEGGGAPGGTGDGGTGDGGSEDNGGTGGSGDNGGGTGGEEDPTEDPYYNPDPDRITIDGNPETDDKDVVTKEKYSYKTLSVNLKKALIFYDGQVIDIADLYEYIDWDTSKLVITRSGAGEENVTGDELKKYLCFTGETEAGKIDADYGTKTLKKENTKITVSAKITDRILAGDMETCDLTCQVTSYKVMIQHPYDSGEYDPIYTNNATISLKKYYQDTIQQLMNDESYWDSETGVLKKLFPGWVQENGASEPSISSITLTGTETDPVINPAEFTSIPKNYQIQLLDGQQTMTAYTGTGDTITVPAGVSALAITSKNDKVTTIQIPESVTDIDFASIAKYFPNCSKYQLIDASGAEISKTATFCEENGMLYSADKKTLLNVPVNYPASHNEIVLFNFDSKTVLPDTVTCSIGEYAFQGMSESVSLTIPKEITIRKGWEYVPENSVINVAASDNHIYYLRHLYWMNGSNLVLQENEQVLDGYTVTTNGIRKGTTLVYIPPTVEGIYTIGSSITEITDTAFYDNKSITTLVIPENVTSIKAGAFANMNNLQTVYVENPQAITGDETGLFSAENTTVKIYLKGTVKGDSTYKKWLKALEKTYDDSAEEHLVCVSTEVYIHPADGAIYYKTSTGSNNYVLHSLPEAATKYEVPTDITVVGIEDNAFYHCTNLKQIEIPDEVQSIGANAFDRCSALEILLYNDNNDVKEACEALELEGYTGLRLVADKSQVLQDHHAYYSLDHKTLLAVNSDYQGELTLEEATINIAPKAAYGCSGITRVVVPSKTLDSIGASAFEKCTGLIDLPEDTSLREIGNRAFTDCKSLTSIIIHGQGVTLGKWVFSGCDQLSRVQWGAAEGDSIITTGTYTFSQIPVREKTSGEAASADNTALRRTDFVGTIANIGEGTFENCTSLSQVTYQLNFEHGIEKIGDNAFKNCSQMVMNGFFTNMHVLKEIGSYAFYNCPKLQYVQIDAALETIGDYAFAQEDQENDSSISSFVIASDSQLTSIGEGAFANNLQLKNLYLAQITAPGGVTIGDAAFQNCSGLISSYWGTNTLASIGDCAFEGCSQLTDAKLNTQNNLTEIGASAFAGCENLSVADFSLTPKLTSIRENTFGVSGTLSCSSLNAVTVGSSVTSIEDGAFVGASGLTNLTLLSSTKVSIGENVFYKGADGTSGDVIDGLTIKVADASAGLLDAYMEDAAWTSALTYTDPITEEATDKTAEVFNNLPEGQNRYYSGGSYALNADGTYTLISMDTGKSGGASLLTNTTEIAEGAFKGCDKITTVILPGRTTAIGKNAFEGCTALEALVFQNEEGTKIDTSLFGDTKNNSNFRIYIPFGTVMKYADNEAINTYKVICSGNSYSCETVSGCVYAHYDADADTGKSANYQIMYLPRSYQGILTISNGIDYIYKEAARNCDGLTNVQADSFNLISVGDYAFADCDNLETVELNADTNGSKFRNLGEGAFQNCEKLIEFDKGSASLVIIWNVSSMGEGVFKGCKAITKASWASVNLSDIPASTFEDCTNLTQMTFDAKLTNTGNPVTSFGDRCFAGCTSFTSTAGSLASFGGLESIGKECYDGCSNMSLLVLPEKLKTIGENAFRGCTYLKVMAMNTREPISVRNAGISDETWANIGIYVPTGRGAAYLAAWSAEAVAAPGNIVDPCEKYRALGGNIYGCEDPTWTYYGATSGGVYHSGLVFFGTSNTGAISIYGSGTYRTTEIGANALKGNINITAFNGYYRSQNSTTKVISYNTYITEIGESAFENCVNLKSVNFISTIATDVTGHDEALVIGNKVFKGCSNLVKLLLPAKTAGIGSEAFAEVGTQTEDGFVLDATRITTPANCKLGEKIFGETIPVGATIKITDTYKAKYASTWAAQLQEEYNLTDEELIALFGGIDVVTIPEEIEQKEE